MEPSSQLGGIYADKPGYHNTRAANSSSNYSVVDGEDRGGPSDKAAAIDWTFPEAQTDSYDRIAKYSKRLLDSGKDPTDVRLDGWREFYGQADQDTKVEGWDFRYVEPSTSDPSHLWHIHLSEDRDKVNDYENKKKLLSVLRGEPVSFRDDKDFHFLIYRQLGMINMDDPIIIPEHKQSNTPAKEEPNPLAQAIKALQPGTVIGTVDLTAAAVAEVAAAVADELNERLTD